MQVKVKEEQFTKHLFILHTSICPPTRSRPFFRGKIKDFPPKQLLKKVNN